jgi:hypothetical protein
MKKKKTPENSSYNNYTWTIIVLSREEIRKNKPKSNFSLALFPPPPHFVWGPVVLSFLHFYIRIDNN